MTNSYSRIHSLIRKFALYAAIFCTVSACGLKGDLYLPVADEEARPQVVGSSDATPVGNTADDEIPETKAK